MLTNTHGLTGMLALPGSLGQLHKLLGLFHQMENSRNDIGTTLYNTAGDR